MGKQYRLNGLKCPHCGLFNSAVVSLPLYGSKEHIVKCWDSEIQSGCQMEFVLRQSVQIVADFTKEQKVEREKKFKEQSSFQLIV